MTGIISYCPCRARPRCIPIELRLAAAQSWVLPNLVSNRPQIQVVMPLCILFSLGRVAAVQNPQVVVVVILGRRPLAVKQGPAGQEHRGAMLALDPRRVRWQTEDAANHGPEDGHAGAKEDAPRLGHCPDEVVHLPGLVEL